MSIFEAQLAKDRANYEALTPVSFLRRAAQVVPSHTAIIHGQRRYTYAQFLARSSQLANALAGRGIGPTASPSWEQTHLRCWRRTMGCRCSAQC